MRPLETEPTVWRNKINSQREDLLDHELWDEAKAYARAAGIIGVGWGPPEVPAGATLDEVLRAVEAKPGWGPTGPQTIRRLAHQVEDGDMMWTRDSLGGYWLCRVTGPWRYDGSEDASRWDLNNIRPAEWLSRPFRDYDVPGAVVRSFTGPGATLRRVPHDAAARVTKMMFERETNPNAESPAIDPEDVLTDLLDPIDVEDVVLLLLQSQGWLLLPSSRMNDTPIYEAALRHRDGRIAVVSVKSGPSAFVPIPELTGAAADAEVFVYSTHDAYSVPPSEYGAIQITRQQLVDFIAANPDLLPPRIERWTAPKGG